MHQELEIRLQVSHRNLGAIRKVLVPCAYEVVDENLAMMLSVPVDAAVPLLESVRVPWDLGVDHQIAVVLEVDALGGGIGCNEDANSRFPGRRLEGGLDLLTQV